jgi:hypothetical protein
VGHDKRFLFLRPVPLLVASESPACQRLRSTGADGERGRGTKPPRKNNRQKGIARFNQIIRNAMYDEERLIKYLEQRPMLAVILAVIDERIKRLEEGTLKVERCETKPCKHHAHAATTLEDAEKTD